MVFGCGWRNGQTVPRASSPRRLSATPGVRIAWPTEANEVFVVAPKALAAWRAGGAKFHDWTTRSLAAEQAPRKGETLVRLVTSFETAPDEIDRLVGLSARAPAAAASAVTAPHLAAQIGPGRQGATDR